MQDDNIDFSIIVPTYNRADHVGTAVRSLLEQKGAVFEVIVVDDGSTDNTEKVIDDFHDKRVRYYKKRNEERSIARNFGIEKAIGRYVGFLDADDYILPNHLSEALQFAEKTGFPEVFHLGYRIEKENREIVSVVSDFTAETQRHLIVDNPLICNAVFIRKDIADRHRFIESSDVSFAEDWYLWLVLASRYTIQFYDVVTSVVVEHDQRSLQQLSPLKVKRSIDVIVRTLFADRKFREKYDEGFDRFVSERYLYCANLSLTVHSYKLFLNCLLQSLLRDPFRISQRLFKKLCKRNKAGSDG